ILRDLLNRNQIEESKQSLTIPFIEFFSDKANDLYTSGVHAPRSPILLCLASGACQCTGTDRLADSAVALPWMPHNSAIVLNKNCCKPILPSDAKLVTRRTHITPFTQKVPIVAESRASILTRLRAKIAQGIPIIGGGAGTGISAKCEEAGGIDLIVIYNSGRFRMAGRGSLSGLMPYGNANQIVREMAYEVLTAVSHTPVLAGVCGTDPFMIRECFLQELKSLGFAGIQNFPTVGLIDGVFRANLEETGMGFQLEVDCIAAAHQLDMLTTPYAFNAEEAIQLTQAGADIIVAHMGLTTSGTIGAATALTLDESVDRVAEIADAARSARSDVIVLCHGGPIAMPDDAKYVLDRLPRVDGFYGASSMERLPTEIALTEQVRQFTAIRRSGLSPTP
ncbi:MAG: phosphoenolpyruvate hydrolase family protein, partial [Planctomycetaceae bacterium]|nr:phosphoenolpyruvate hydrolase family protein [Planctomycetaceae bacterium]